MYENFEFIPLKLTKRGKFEGMTWKNPSTPTKSLSSIFQCNFLGYSRKNFTVGSQKFRCVNILTSKWYILIINWFGNGCITVIFKICLPVPYLDFRVWYPEIRVWYGSYITHSLRWVVIEAKVIKVRRKKFYSFVGN